MPRLYAIICIICSSLIPQACGKRGDSAMHEPPSGAPSVNLGEVYSNFLSSVQRWKVISVAKGGKTEIFEDERRDQPYFFEKDGSGNGRNGDYFFRWRFSDSGQEFTVTHDDKEYIFQVVDLSARRFVVDQMGDNGDFIRLVYGADEDGDGHVHGPDCACEVLRAQAKDACDEVEKLRANLDLERKKFREVEARNVKSNEEKAAKEKELERLRKAADGVADKLKIRQEEAEAVKKAEALARNESEEKAETQLQAIRGLRGFLHTKRWRGPGKNLATDDPDIDYSGNDTEYVFDSGYMSLIRLVGGGYKAVVSSGDKDQQRQWRVYKVDLKEGTFEFTNAPGRESHVDGKHRRIKAYTNFVKSFRKTGTKNEMRINFGETDDGKPATFEVRDPTAYGDLVGKYTAK